MNNALLFQIVGLWLCSSLTWLVLLGVKLVYFKEQFTVINSDINNSVHVNDLVFIVNYQTQS